MKHFVPLILGLLLAACVSPSPEDLEAAHQLELAKEARENFYALKAQINPHFRPPATPTPTPGFFAFAQPRPAAVVPAMPAPPPRRRAAATPTPRLVAVVQKANNPPPPPRATPPPRRPVVAQVAYNPPPTSVETPRTKHGPKPKNQGDTVYYWQVNHPEQPAAAQHFTRAEIRYAHDLDKSPAQLTPTERSHARAYYLGIGF